jgi:DNA-3-methyladenine glycosylase
MSDWQILEGSAETVAPRLLGCVLERELDGVLVRVRIVETEAYHQSDAASHSYRGKTPRTEVMFGPAGHAYVYFTYGMHYCMNIVTGPAGEGSAVLIRAVEPLAGEAVLNQHRVGKTGVDICNGPAKLCQALAIDKSWNGHNLHELPLRLVLQPQLQKSRIVQTTRIGISQARDMPWRFYEQNNPYVSVR